MPYTFAYNGANIFLESYLYFYTPQGYSRVWQIIPIILPQVSTLVLKGEIEPIDGGYLLRYKYFLKPFSLGYIKNLSNINKIEGKQKIKHDFKKAFAPF